MRVHLFTILLLACSSAGLGQMHPSQADFNGDGKVDIADLAEFASAWLWESSCSTAIEIQMDTHYARSAQNSYWYVFVPEFTFFYEISLAGGATGYTGSVYASCEDVAIGQTNEETQRTVLLLEEGISYYIEIERTGEPTGDFDLVVTISE